MGDRATPRSCGSDDVARATYPPGCSTEYPVGCREKGHAAHAQDSRNHCRGEAAGDARRSRPGGRTPDADGSPGGGGLRVRGETPRGARGGRPRSGGAQRLRSSAPSDDGRRHGGSEGAAGQRSEIGASLHQLDPAAVHAPVAESRRGAAGALPAGSVDGELQGSSRRPAGGEGVGPVRLQHRADDRGLGRGVPVIQARGPEREALRLRVGGRRASPGPPGGRPPVHAGPARRALRRDQGADRGRGRLPGECGELVERAARPEAPRAAGAWPGYR